MAFPPRWEGAPLSLHGDTPGIPGHAEVKRGPVLTLVIIDFYCLGGVSFFPFAMQTLRLNSGPQAW